MISKDGLLTYANKGGILQATRIDNKILNTVVLAALTTIIAYQGKAIFFDLLLGLKRRGVTRIRDLHIFLLSGESSPLAVLDALFRSDWLTRKRLRGDVPKGTTISRDRRRITTGACAKLLLLIVIGPLANIIAISLTLERERNVTMEEAGLGGLTVGINENLKAVRREIESKFCERVLMDLQRDELALSQFHICRIPLFQIDVDDETPQDVAGTRVLLFQTGSIVVSVITGEDTSTFLVDGTIRSNGTNYHIKPNFTQDDARLLARVGTKVLRDICGSVGEEQEEISNIVDVYIVRKVDCPKGLTSEDSTSAMVSMLNVITVKEAPSLEVVPFLEIPVDDLSSSIPYIDGKSLLLLRRTRGSASLLILLIIAASIIVLRVIVRIFAYNDLPVAIEVVLRDRFELPCCDSMLQNDTQVEYRKRFQLVEMAHFGMSSETLPEVDRLVGGSVE